MCLVVFRCCSVSVVFTYTDEVLRNTDAGIFRSGIQFIQIVYLFFNDNK